MGKTAGEAAVFKDGRALRNVKVMNPVRSGRKQR